jgi:rhodanese-related sulfurtransferase
VREPSEYNAGYIPGALNIPAGTLVFKIANQEFWDNEMLYMPEKDEELIIYCKKGKRGVLAAEALGKLGYKNVINISGGWKKWELTYPLEYEKNLDAMGGEHHEEEGGC